MSNSKNDGFRYPSIAEVEALKAAAHKARAREMKRLLGIIVQSIAARIGEALSRNRVSHA